jgi:hypothetical protein
MLNRAYALWIAIGTGALLLSGAKIVAQDAAPQTYPVHGTVIDSVTHQPIARALVDSHTHGAVLTGNDGHFEFDLPAGSVNLMVRRPGYEPHSNMLVGHNVQVGSNTPDLTFTLTPEAFITGQVTLSTADPADGIRVIAYRRHIVNGHPQWTMQSMASTNSEGIFRIARLEAGDYLLYTQSARGREGPILPGAQTFGYPPVYYPGTADSSSSAVLPLTAGQHAQADFTLTRQRYYPVTFLVSDPQAAARLNFQIHDAAGHPTGFPVHWNAMQGVVQADVPNGHYYLEATGGLTLRGLNGGGFIRFNAGSGQMYGRVEFTVANTPLIGLRLPLISLRSIQVNLHKDFTASGNQSQLSGFQGNPNDLNSAPMLSLVPADELFSQQATPGMLRPMPGNNDGSTFELPSVSPGRYWVVATYSLGYVSSITCGGSDLAREPLTIGQSGASAPIDITLRNDIGAISGQIQSSASTANPLDGQAGVSLGEQSRIYIYAIPLFSFSGNLPQGHQSSGGQFSITNLAPGSYRVLAFDTPQEIDFHTPEGLAKFTGKGQDVTVPAGGTANAQIDVIQTSTADTSQ